MSEYLVVQHGEDPRAWRIKGVGDAIPDDFRLVQGVRLAPDYPARVVLDLHPSSGNMKVDFVRNLDRVLIASGRARELLLASGVSEKDVELLPAFLRDKKGRVLDEPYTIVNPIGSIRCMDRKRSEFDTYTGSDEVMGVGRLFMEPDRVPEHLVLFRLGEDPKLILVRSDLLEEIEGAGLTGLRAVPLGEPIL
jgi:hypothetical protein